jgi:hypothetical protein
MDYLRVRATNRGNRIKLSLPERTVKVVCWQRWQQRKRLGAASRMHRSFAVPPQDGSVEADDNEGGGRECPSYTGFGFLVN